MIVPTTPYDAKGLLLAAIADDDPVLFFEHMRLYNTRQEVPEDPYTVPIGSASVTRPGTDVTIVGISYMAKLALEVAAALASDGIEAEVIDPRSLSPLDSETILESVRKTGRLVVVGREPAPMQHRRGHRRHGLGARFRRLGRTGEEGDPPPTPRCP